MSKYGAKKTVVDGIKFDSRAEARRFETLKLMQKAGMISDLKRQVVYTLLPGVKYSGDARAKPALRYVADFTYVEGGQLVVDDTKGVITEGFRIKRHLMKHIHNIDLRLSK